MSVKPNGSNDLAETRFEFLFILIGKSTIILLFYKANHDVYSNPGTQLRVQSKDFVTVSQTDLTTV